VSQFFDVVRIYWPFLQGAFSVNNQPCRCFAALVALLLLFTVSVFAAAPAMQTSDSKLKECQAIIAHSSDADQLARAYLEMGIIMSFSTNRNRQEDIAALQKVISKYPQSRFVDDALWYLAKAYLFSLPARGEASFHDEGKAISAYQTGLDKYKGIRWERLSDTTGKPPDNLTSSLLKGEIEKLKMAATQRDALETQIKIESEPQKAVKLYFNLAKAHRSLANFPQAVKIYRQIIQRFPIQKEAAQAQFEMGEVYFNDKIALFDELHYAPLSDLLKRLAYEKAIKQYQKVVNNYPESEWAPQAMHRIGKSYLHMEEYTKAKEACERLIEKYPESSLTAKAKELSSQAASKHRLNLARQEYGGAYVVVEGFCQAWQSKDYKAMYELLSQSGKVEESKEEFIKRYEGYEAKGGQLVEYTLFPPIAGGDEVVIVRVNMRFNKDIPNEIISGVNRFDMAEEEGNWRIKEMRVPIQPPPLYTLPNSHPGDF